MSSESHEWFSSSPSCPPVPLEDWKSACCAHDKDQHTSTVPSSCTECRCKEYEKKESILPRPWTLNCMCRGDDVLSVL